MVEMITKVFERQGKIKLTLKIVGTVKNTIC